MQNAAPSLANKLAIPGKVKHGIKCDLEIPFQDVSIYLQEIKTGIQIICMPMSIVAFSQ